MTGRVVDAVTTVAARSYPKSGGTDRRVVRDCARDAIAANGVRALVRESIALVTAGLRARTGLASVELIHAPWRAALQVLTLPLAAAILLTWTYGFVPRYDHWPLGEGWMLLLGGSAAAVVGAALRHRWLTAGGATAVFVAAAAPYVGFGTEEALAGTPSFFRGWNLDFGASSLLPTLLLIVGGLSLPRGPRPPTREMAARLGAGLGPAAIAAPTLLQYATPTPTVGYLHRYPHLKPIVQLGPPYSMPWLPPSRGLTLILGVALAIALVVAWRAARAHPEWGLATGLVLVSVAFPLTWELTRTDGLHVPWWLLNLPYPLLLTTLPLLLALVVMRHAAGATRSTPPATPG
jgi:hypothetical protein